jgi:hypothetical protein
VQFGYAMYWVMLFCFPLMVERDGDSAASKNDVGGGAAT